jgi:myo-inositol catabolism protein IolC
MPRKGFDFKPVTLNVYLHPKQAKELRAHAHARSISMAKAVRKALEEYLTNERVAEKQRLFSTRYNLKGPF